DTGFRVLTTEAPHGPLQIDEISLVGAYAVRLTWSDGHDTGFYSFRFLRALCPHEGGATEGIRFETFRDVRDLLRQEGKDDEERRTPDGKPRQE
ncbi:MAG: gamma-butyrobetaine hydroxylase-like domain-containing protein, partial [Candidatus Tectimicrobiota bacterium]